MKSLREKTINRLDTLSVNNWPTRIYVVKSNRKSKIANVPSSQPYFRIIYNTAGAQKVTYPTDVGSEHIVLKRGEVLLICPGSWVYGQHMNTHFNNIGIRLSEKSIDIFENNEKSWPENRNLYSYPLGLKNSAVKELQHVFENCRSYGNMNERLMIRYAALIAPFVESIIDGKVGESETKGKNRLFALQESLAFTNNSFNKKINKSQISREFDIPEHSINPFFKKNTGLSFRGYLLKKRMEFASEILCHPIMSLLQIATICGYSSLESFIHAFKKFYGIPPRQMRTRLLSGSSQSADKNKKNWGKSEIIDVLPMNKLEELKLPQEDNGKEVNLHFFNASNKEVTVYQLIVGYKRYHHGGVGKDSFKHFRVKSGAIFVVKSIDDNFLGCFQLFQKQSIVVFD